ncbi:MAG: hypothetical protein EZS28_017371 [Streblomastix strix]|uniref:Uncharacterized protein n=1 Tax=Streblomastix strix TaxID=222440 RepID=A0A5J4VX60_9EUKA|nr:MAG: hypothetical protein EZS28_017371 [Streblomastix strix]
MFKTVGISAAAAIVTGFKTVENISAGKMLPLTTALCFHGAFVSSLSQATMFASNHIITQACAIYSVLF